MPTQSQWQQEEQVSRIDDHPKGYPQLAAFINSDECFLMCRRFGWLNSRVLLYRQAELADLEETLLEMDKEDNAYRGGITLHSMKEDDERVDIKDPQLSRKTLINKIDTKLKEYREFSLPVLFPTLNVKTKKVLEADILAFVNRGIDIPSQNPCRVEKTKHAQLQFSQRLDD